MKARDKTHVRWVSSSAGRNACEAWAVTGLASTRHHAHCVLMRRRERFRCVAQQGLPKSYRVLVVSLAPSGSLPAKLLLRGHGALVYSRARTPRADALDCLLVKTVTGALLNPHIARDSILADGDQQFDQPLDAGCTCFGCLFWLVRRHQPRNGNTAAHAVQHSRHALASTLIADEKR